MKIEMCDEFYYRIKEKSESVEFKFNSSKENVLRNNNKIEVYPGEMVYVKRNKFIIHHVKPMETLSSIAKIYNLTEEKISLDNDLKTDKLFIGQLLKILKADKA